MTPSSIKNLTKPVNIELTNLDDCTACIQAKTCNTDACKDCPWCAYCLNYPTADICLNSDLPKYSSNVTESETVPCQIIPSRIPECPDENGIGCEDLSNQSWVCQENSRNYDPNNLVVWPTCLGDCTTEFPCRDNDCFNASGGTWYGSDCSVPCNEWFLPTKCPDSTDTAQWTTLDYGTSCCGCHIIICECSGVDCPGGQCQGVDGGTPTLPEIYSIDPPSGPVLGGITITITGKYFTGTIRVTIGGYEATEVNIVSDTVVTAVIPPLVRFPNEIFPTNRALIVTTPVGVSAISNFEYYDNTSPTITTVTPNSGTTLGGTAITIIGNNLLNTSNVIIGGVAATSVVVVSATQITAITPSGSVGVKPVAVTTPNGSVTKSSAFTYVYIEPAPTITSISPTSGSSSGGTAIRITGTNFNLLKNLQVYIGSLPATIGTVSNNTLINAITPPGLDGDADVTVSTIGGIDVLEKAFTYVAAPCSIGVKGWGRFINGPSDYGTDSPPQTVKYDVIAVHAGRFHTIALKNDGSVIAWGQANQYGECLGTNRDGTAILGIASGQPVKILGEDLTEVIAVEAGTEFSVALKSDGSVIAWGNNNYGQCTVPSEALSDVTSISCGLFHVLALKSNGSVISWGSQSANNYGQGNIPTIAQSGVTAIAAGQFHSLALTNTGAVLAWGQNIYGQCTVPTAALNGVIAIASGSFHSIALKNDGTVIAWGRNNYGQCLGTSIVNGVVSRITTTPTGAPVQISGQVLTAVSTISAGDYHTVALKDGGVIAWGDNFYGQLNIPAFANTGVSTISIDGVRTVVLDKPECVPPPTCPSPYFLELRGVDSCGCDKWECTLGCPSGQHLVVIGTDSSGNEIRQCQNDCGICAPPPVCTGPDAILIPIRTDECGCITYECIDGFVFEGNADIKTNAISPSGGKELVFHSQVAGKDATSPHHFVTKRQISSSGNFASEQYINQQDQLNLLDSKTYSDDKDTIWVNEAKNYADLSDLAQSTGVPDYSSQIATLTSFIYPSRSWNTSTKIMTSTSKITEVADTVYPNTDIQIVAAAEKGIYKNTTSRDLRLNIVFTRSSSASGLVAACLLVGEDAKTIAQDFNPILFTSQETDPLVATGETRSYMKTAVQLSNESTVNLHCIVPKNSWYRAINSGGTLISWKECKASE